MKANPSAPTWLALIGCIRISFCCWIILRISQSRQRKNLTEEGANCLTNELSQNFLYLTTTGWKSDKPHEIEIWFVRHDGRFYIVSEHADRSHWVQNIKNRPKVSFRVDEHTYQGEGRPVNRKKEPELAGAVSALMKEKYKWSDGLIMELVPQGAAN